MKDALQCPSLFQAYEKFFRIGAAINGRMALDPAYSALICRHFNSVTADNQMKLQFVMDHRGTLAQGDPRRAAILRNLPIDIPHPDCRHDIVTEREVSAVVFFSDDPHTLDLSLRCDHYYSISKPPEAQNFIGGDIATADNQKCFIGNICKKRKITHCTSLPAELGLMPGRHAYHLSNKA